MVLGIPSPGGMVSTQNTARAERVLSMKTPDGGSVWRSPWSTLPPSPMLFCHLPSRGLLGRGPGPARGMNGLYSSWGWRPGCYNELRFAALTWLLRTPAIASPSGPSLCRSFCSGLPPLHCWFTRLDATRFSVLGTLTDFLKASGSNWQQSGFVAHWAAFLPQKPSKNQDWRWLYPRNLLIWLVKRISKADSCIFPTFWGGIV